MKAIVDTHLLLQILIDDPKLSAAARELLADPANEIFVSMASLWEISVKFSLGKLKADPQTVSEAVSQSGFSRLNVEDAHMQVLSGLPWRHNDLFGRIIVAQSIAEPMKLLTSDWRLAAYGGPVLLV
jgi:PIN domain nuclease of toxin-antitoxin system